MDKLLAKSPKPLTDGRVIERTLLQHTEDVVQAARALFGADVPTHLGQRWLEFFQIPDQWEPFRKNLLAACVLHDWGKANDGFQKSVRNKGDQLIRHEHLSTMFLTLPEVRAWLTKGDYDLSLVMSVVMTHHLKAGDTEDGICTQLKDSGEYVRVAVDSPDFAELQSKSAEWMGLPLLSPTAIPMKWSWVRSGQNIDDSRDQIFEEMAALECKIDRSDTTRRLLLALRSALICADGAGSGLARVGHLDSEAAGWIQDAVTNRELLTNAEVEGTVISGRVKEMQDAGRWSGFNKFQEDCENLPDRALLLAPCGSGKTLAAWKWIASRLKDRPRGHALFLYPTRATAREGFKDYVSWAPGDDAALMHGTSEYDLQDMFENPTDDDDRFTREYRTERGLFSMSYWSKRAFAATVDQFLAFMQYSYGPMCMLPVLVDSVLVIDEVHSFDRNMFGSLKDFLRRFQVPVLCMTASLQQRQRDELIQCGLTPPQEWPEDLLSVARAPRYRMQHAASRHEAEQAVRNALAGGKRVLWVVNQVKRAHEIVRSFAPSIGSPDSLELRTPDGVPVVCYHSRFTLNDRGDRHRQTMRYLKPHWTKAALGVTTQVCEMSLDIDVDLLVTEEAPVSSLIQRMGRCNRIKEPRSLVTSGHVMVYPPEGGDTKPYSPNDLRGLKEFIEKLSGRDLNQEDLELAMLEVPSPQSLGDPLSMFWESGAFAVGPKEVGGQEFRDTNDFSQQCILPRDIDDFLKNLRDRPGYVLPIPKGKVDRSIDTDATRRLPRYLGVARDGHYHPAVGFCDSPINEWRAE